MIRIDSLKLALTEPLENLPLKAAKLLKIKPGQIGFWRVRKKAVDARKKSDIHFVYSIELSLTGGEAALVARLKNAKATLVSEPVADHTHYLPPSVRPVVVGFGPAGIFAALRLAKAGLCPLVIERGQAVPERMTAIAQFWQSGELKENSNVAFGEGGAGTFSDGKLTTGIKSPNIRGILEEFVDCGGQEEILFNAKPHIGTDVLIKIVQNLRKKIIALGGDIYFEHTLVDIQYADNTLKSLTVATAAGEKDIPCDFCLLASGHSARDTYEMLLHNRVRLEAKAFAMGLRIEHRQSFIDQAQYGDFAGHPALPAADYKLAVHLPGGHSVYTFCMCPGGQVVAASSESGGVVVNGMSYAARAGENANSALLVSLNPMDFPRSDTPLAGMYWQREVEQACYRAGGANYYAPAQRVGDFLRGCPSQSAGAVLPSYRPGVTWTDLGGVLPEIITGNLRLGLLEMDRIIPGFADAEAVLTAVESRSSSPVRIWRDGQCQSSVRGLYCCGEGAGYSGGIVSSAADGIKCAEAMMATAEQRKIIIAV